MNDTTSKPDSEIATTPPTTLSDNDVRGNLIVYVEEIRKKIIDAKKLEKFDASITNMEQIAETYKVAKIKTYSGIFFQRAEKLILDALMATELDNPQEKANIIAGFYKQLVGYVEDKGTRIQLPNH